MWVSADVVAWCPVDEGDMAVLRLREDGPPGAAAARLDERVRGVTTSLRVFGYPGAWSWKHQARAMLMTALPSRPGN